MSSNKSNAERGTTVTEGARDRELVVHTHGDTSSVRNALLHAEGVTTVRVRCHGDAVECHIRHDSSLTPREQAAELISTLVQRTAS